MTDSKRKARILSLMACVMPIVYLSCGMSSCTDHHEEPRILITGILSNRHEPMLDFWPDTLLNNRVKVFVALYQKSHIDNAVVSISYNDHVVVLDTIHRDGLSLYIDKENLVQIIPGERYELNVTLTDGRTFEAYTRVPLIPEVTSPGNGDTITPIVGGETGYFAFEAIRDDRSLAQLILSTTDYEGVSTSGYYYTISKPPTLAHLFGSSNISHKQIDYYTLDSALSFYSWRMAKTIFGVDSAYNAMYSKLSDRPIEDYSNIMGTNGVGCFGSFTGTHTDFYLRKD